MLIILIAYLIGAIPTGYLAKKSLIRFSPKSSSSKSALWLNFIKITAVAADAAKGILLILLLDKLYILLSNSSFSLLLYPLVSKGLSDAVAIVTAVIAHIFSVYVSGWGGKGSAVILGGFLVLTPLITCYALVGCLLILIISRKISYASFGACCSLPVLLYLFDGEQIPFIAAAMILAVLSIITHHREMISD